MHCSSALWFRFPLLRGVVVAACVMNVEKGYGRVGGYVILAVFSLKTSVLSVSQDFGLFLWGFSELSPAGQQLSGVPRDSSAAWRKGNRVFFRLCSSLFIPLCLSFWAFFISIMALFLLSRDWIPSSTVASRFFWCSPLLPWWSFR